MSGHQIRLRGPWTYEWLADNPASEVAAAGRVRMPCDWKDCFGDSAGTARFSRVFHRPSHLETDERVRILIDGVGGTGSVAVNDHRVGMLHELTKTGAYDVTDVLQPINRLVVEIHHDPGASSGPAGLYGLVTLEITRQSRVKAED